MTVVRVKGFKIFDDRHGHRRCYHRKTGIAIDLKKAPIGSVEFMAECARICALTTVATAAKPGTLGKLIAEYRAHASYTNLEPRTRKDYQRVFDYLKPIADTPLVKFDRPLIVRIRDKAAITKGRRQANYVQAVLSLLFGWGKERGHVIVNPASGIKPIARSKTALDANPPWPDEARHVVLNEVPAHMLPAIALMMFTGLGPKDALRLPKNFYKDGDIATSRTKTGEAVFWQCPAQLAVILAAAPKHDAITVCANSDGKPWTVSGFNSSWQKIKRRLVREGKFSPTLTLYGLRHTVAVILRELGYDDRAIADALGQRDPKMALHYAKGADLKPKMRGVVDKFDVEMDKRKTKAVNPDK
jgi:integrase